MLRYAEQGELHKDFYRTLNGTIAYLRRRYGVEFLDETLRRMGRDVYAAIRAELMKGNPEHLVEHWLHFFGREAGDVRLVRAGQSITLKVSRCPAVHYLLDRNVDVDPCFCRQTEVVNRALCEGTPFDITTNVTGPGRCEQTIRRKRT